MLCLTFTLGVFIMSTYATFSGPNKDTCDKYAAVGETLSLPLDIKTLALKDVLKWTHNNTIIFHRQGPKVHVGKPENISAEGSLQLRNIIFTSAGIYKAEVMNENGQTVRHTSTRLCIMEKLSKPKVLIVCDNTSSTVKLSCSADSCQGVVFAWTQNKQPLPSETRSTLSISLTKLKGENTFSCHVSNKISASTSDNVHVICTEPAAPTLVCFRATTVVAALAGGGGVILILLIILVVVCCRRRRAQLRLDDIGALPMAPVTRRQEADTNILQYETMDPHGTSLKPLPEGIESPLNTATCIQDTGQQGIPEDEEQCTARVAEGQQPFPVPKPRTKTPRTPNI